MVKNFHLPLPVELYRLLRESAQEEKIPATKLVKQLLQEWLEKRRRKAIQAEFRAFGKEYGGTKYDLDPDFEQAGIECLLQLPPYEKG